MRGESQLVYFGSQHPLSFVLCSTSPQQSQHGRAATATLSHSVPPVKTLTVVYRLGFVGQRDNRGRGPERGRRWMEFPRPVQSRLLPTWRGHGRPASVTVWPGRCTWMINAGLLCFIHSHAFSFSLSASLPWFLCLATVKNAGWRMSVWRQCVWPWWEVFRK